MKTGQGRSQNGRFLSQKGCFLYHFVPWRKKVDHNPSTSDTYRTNRDDSGTGLSRTDQGLVGLGGVEPRGGRGLGWVCAAGLGPREGLWAGLGPWLGLCGWTHGWAPGLLQMQRIRRLCTRLETRWPTQAHIAFRRQSLISFAPVQLCFIGPVTRPPWWLAPSISVCRFSSNPLPGCGKGATCIEARAHKHTKLLQSLHTSVIEIEEARRG